MGRIIEIVGVDGSGKSTQASLLAAALHELGERSLCFDTPKGSPLADAAAREFQRTGSTPLTFETLALNSALARSIQYENEVRPLVEKGGNAIYTRYKFSIQHYFRARGADARFVKEIHARLPMPTHAILLEIDMREAMYRIDARGSARDFEERDASYLENIQRGMLSEWPAEFLRLRAEQPPKKIHAAILKYIIQADQAA